MIRTRAKGQSTAEYAIVFGVVVAALVAMQVYIKRGTQAQIKGGVDTFTKAGTTDQTWLDDAGITGANYAVTMKSTANQYEPYYAQSKYDTFRDSTMQETVDMANANPDERKIYKKITGQNNEEVVKRAGGGFQKQLGAAGAD